MTLDEEWSTPEIVRTLAALTIAVKELTVRLDGLGDNFLRKETADIMRSDTMRRIDEVGTRVVDVEADLARFRKETADLARSSFNVWVPPVVVALIAGAIAFVIAIIPNAH